MTRLSWFVVSPLPIYNTTIDIETIIIIQILIVIMTTTYSRTSRQ